MTQPFPSLPPKPLLSLQVLRAVAALLVVIHHAGYDADAVALRTGAAPLGLGRFVDLAFGVHLFFVVSGFIMLRTARGFGSGWGALVFMARRAMRVVPLYWLLTSLTLLGGAVAPRLLNGEPGGLAWVLGSYLFVPVARPNGALNPVLGQGWTLNYEMFFYLLFAATMPLRRRIAVPAIAAALAGLVALGRLGAPPFPAVAVWTDGLLLEFLFGLGLAVLAERGTSLGATATAAAGIAGVLAAAATGPATGYFEALAPWLRGGVPATLVVGACVLGPRWPTNRALAALALLGDASYSLYLSHPFAVRSLSAAWPSLAPAGTPPGVHLVLACGLAIIVALPLHRWVERPMTRALHRRSRGTGLAARPGLSERAAEDTRRG